MFAPTLPPARHRDRVRAAALATQRPQGSHRRRTDDLRRDGRCREHGACWSTGGGEPQRDQRRAASELRSFVVDAVNTLPPGNNATLGMTVGEVQAIVSKLDELIAALRRGAQPRRRMAVAGPEIQAQRTREIIGGMLHALLNLSVIGLLAVPL